MMAAAMALAMAPAMRLPMAEGIGGSNGHSTPLPLLVVALVCGSRESLSKTKVTATYGSRFARLALEIER